MQELFFIPFFIAIKPIPVDIAEIIIPFIPLKKNTSKTKKTNTVKFIFL